MANVAMVRIAASRMVRKTSVKAQMAKCSKMQVIESLLGQTIDREAETRGSSKAREGQTKDKKREKTRMVAMVAAGLHGMAIHHHLDQRIQVRMGLHLAIMEGRRLDIMVGLHQDIIHIMDHHRQGIRDMVHHQAMDHLRRDTSTMAVHHQEDLTAPVTLDRLHQAMRAVHLREDHRQDRGRHHLPRIMVHLLGRLLHTDTMDKDIMALHQIATEGMVLLPQAGLLHLRVHRPLVHLLRQDLRVTTGDCHE